MRTLLVCTAALGLACAACESPEPRLNAPPHGMAENTSEMQGMYLYMMDNALLADMSISDIHFVPHRPMLNTLGEQRLTRLASLIEVYGGEVLFSTNVKEKKLIDERTEAIREFLCDAGIDTATDGVRLDMPGGRGLEATEVILIKAKEGTYQPKKSDSGPSTGSSSGMSAPMGSTPNQ